ncbi:MAG: PilW family protein [Gallionellaceae bacterium]
MFSEKTFRKDQAKGFSLVEVMVGMTVGLLSMLVIMQTLSVFETQKRSTTSGSDAQVNGLLSLVSMEQSIRSAGSGYANTSAFVCTTIYAWYDNGTTSAPIPMSVAPVSISNGATSTDSDSITIQTATNFLGNIPTQITKTMPSSSSELNVSSTIGFTANDLILVADPASGNCTLMQLTQVQSGALKLQHNPGGTTSFNPTVAYQNTNTWPAYAANSLILDMGIKNTTTYSLTASNKLQAVINGLGGSAVIPTQTLELASDIVNLQAQYGIAASGVQNVTAWVNADSSTGTNWATPTLANVKRIKAIRLVVVARSGKKELQDVTQDCTNTLGSGGINKGPCAWADTLADPAPKIDLSANADYKRYRYKVYTTVIPLRNVIWANI